MDDHTSAAATRDAPADPAPATPGSRRLIALFWTLCVTVLVLDQVTKALALRLLDEGDRVEVVGDILQLRLVFNPEAAFGLGVGMTWLLTLVAVVVVAVVVRVSRRLGSRGWAVALGLMLGGALGNLVDRLFREPGFARGHVVDFLALPNWPVFNVADSAITCAAVLVVLLGLRGVSVDGRRGDGRG